MNAHTNLRGFQTYKSGTGAVIARARPGEGFTLEEIAANAPSVVADTKHSSRSARYTYIDTLGVLRGLMAEGFQVVEVRQGGSRVEDKRDFTKHQLRLRHPDMVQDQNRARQVGDLFPELIMANAHDGTSAFQLWLGALKLLCLNGLMVPECVLETVKVPHKGDIRHQVIEGAFRVIEQAPKLHESIEGLRATELSAGEAMAFATAAQQIRWDDPETAPVAPGQIIQARRIEDRARDLWSVMNVAQENLIRGGQSYVRRTPVMEGDRVVATRTQRRQVGEVRSIDDSNRVNRAVWTLAEEMRKLKAA